MRLLVILALAVAVTVADDATSTLNKRTTQTSKSSPNQNSLQQLQQLDQSGKSQSGDYSVSDDSNEQPSPGATIIQQQPQYQTQYIPIQYVQSPHLRPTIALPSPMHQQPIAMILIPQSMLAHSSQGGHHPTIIPIPFQQHYTPQPVPQPFMVPNHNALFNQAAQQLLHYYHTHPQARLQLLQQGSGYYNNIGPQTYQQPAAFQYQPSDVSANSISTTHLTPAQLAGTSSLQNPSTLQYQTIPSSASLQSQSSSGSSQLNTQEYLPQPEKLTAASSSFFSPYAALRAPYKTRY